jgi:gluconolactonase
MRTVTAIPPTSASSPPKSKAHQAGLTVDGKGNLWVAAKGIVLYSPEGKQVHLIEMHDVASALAFGDADFKTLFIASRAIVFRARPDTP